MTISISQRLAAWMFAVAFIFTAGNLSAQGYGESIVGMQVLSDTASPIDTGSYAGDMSPSDAGVEYVDGGVIGGDCSSGNCNGIGSQERKYGQPDLFYNYYTQGNANRANAQMYVSPRPVPPFVGNTFYTYQPFYPHHYLYAHKDRYHNYYDNGRGTNRTRATYSYPRVRTAVSNIYWNKLRLPR